MTYWRDGLAGVIDMKSKFLGAALIALVLFVAALWIKDRIKYRSHFAPPFVELRFHHSKDSDQTMYTLFLAGVSDSGNIVSLGDNSTLKRSNGLIDVFGEGDIQFSGRSIHYSDAVVSVDRQRLPTTPPYAVLTRDGKVAVGSFLRRFD